jgi:hypothetical protein
MDVGGLAHPLLLVLWSDRYRGCPILAFFARVGERCREHGQPWGWIGAAHPFDSAQGRLFRKVRERMGQPQHWSCLNHPESKGGPACPTHPGPNYCRARWKNPRPLVQSIANSNTSLVEGVSETTNIESSNPAS